MCYIGTIYNYLRLYAESLNGESQKFLRQALEILPFWETICWWGFCCLVCLWVCLVFFQNIMNIPYQAYKTGIWKYKPTDKFYFHSFYLKIHKIHQFCDFWLQNFHSFLINFYSVRLLVALDLWTIKEIITLGTFPDKVSETKISKVNLRKCIISLKK